MTSIESVNRLPKFIPSIDETPIEEQFLGKYLDELQTPVLLPKLQILEIELYKDELELAIRKDTSNNNAMLAHIACCSILIMKRQKEQKEISEADQKFLTESLPKVKKILKDSERGTKEYARAAFLISEYMINFGEKEKAIPFLKLGVEEGYGPAMLHLAYQLNMTAYQLNMTNEEKILELYQAAAKKGVRVAAILCEIIERGLNQE